MNIFELEKYREQILKLKSEDFSSRRLLFLLNEYLSVLFNVNNNQLVRAYFTEYLNEYISLLREFDPSGITPNELDFILSIAEDLNDRIVIKNKDLELNAAIEDLRNNASIIKMKLEGKNYQSSNVSQVLFPVLEKRQDNNSELGFLEKLSVYIRRNQDTTEDKFIIVPSIGKTDEQLENQINISWKYAKDFIKKSSRCKFLTHEVVIQFEKKYGIYEGESLGIALTVGFIQELIKFYNLRELVKIKGNIVTTGGINKTGKVKPVSDEIIQKKMQTVFYSTADIFVVAEEDKVFADSKFAELKQLHPKRELEVIPVTKVSDIFNRRDLVEFKKQNFVFWGSKKIIRNKAALFLLAVILFSFTAIIYVSVDNNPSFVTSSELRYIVKNQYGKILWSIKTIEDYSVYGGNKEKMINRHAKIIDIDDDGLNEVLMTRFGGENFNKLLLFNHKGEIINSFSFNYFVETQIEKFTERYTIHEISDVIEIDNRKEVILLADHEYYYPGLVIRLDLEAFKMIGKPLVHSGHLIGVTLNDIDNDGKIEILCNGVSNGYRRSIFFIIELDKLYGTSPALEEYKILGLPIAAFEHYLLLPKSDYGELIYPKYNAPLWPPEIIFKEKIISFGISETHPKNYFHDYAGYSLKFSYNLKNLEIVIGDPSVIERDKFVKLNKLNPPLTDTKEFRRILKKQIQKWTGKEFVQMFSDSMLTE